uniref:Methyltransf_21 domain-containing protein n=1 Tax=Caenorhabditis tropicalis TaxID=1561998 RepID=A0A1I7T726_9PELO
MEPLLYNLIILKEDYKDWVEAEQDEIDLKSVFKRFSTNHIFYKWHTCISENLLWIEDAEKFWDEFMFASQKCDLRANVNQIGIVTLKNYDEQKHVVFPKIYNFGPHNLFSIGIGFGSVSFGKFKKMRKLGNNVTFYGADPVSYINDDLYSRIGTYFPLALGAQSGISSAMVMIEDGGYRPKSMIHVDILYFFKNLLNVTIHKHQDYPERKTEFMVFVKRIIEEKRFGIFGGDQYIHNRMFLFNFESKYCIRKFLNKFA